MEPIWALGFMSGTSLDGIDAAFLLSDGQRIFEKGATCFLPYSAGFRDQLKQCLGQAARTPFIQEIESQLTKLHGEVALKMMAAASIAPHLIGFHGQTIFHAPPQTLQLGDGKRLANLTGVRVVGDFRTHDCANGGQGAPLVPIYHQALAQNFSKPMAIVNIGGVGNITFLGEGDQLIAFDTGPGNALIDDYVLKIYGVPFDDGGKIAASGQADKSLIKVWLADPFFTKLYPKSLDRDHFTRIAAALTSLSPADAVATLTLLTAKTIAQACALLPQQPRELVLCGGGAKNHTFLQFLRQELPEIDIVRAQNLGWQEDFIEAEAFAFLAIRSFYDLPLSFPLTTGVKIPLTGGRVFDCV